MNTLKRAAMAVLMMLVAVTAFGNEAVIRKALSERLPQMGKIDEVTKTTMPGLWEVRVGMEIYYTDAEATYLMHGNLIDTKQARNLTEERTDKLNQIAFSELPMKDAFTIVRGNGKRKIALFGDPNCGYCKRFERDLQKVDNVTIYMFMYPILGDDSAVKARNHWCAKDKGTAWQDWMVRDKPAPMATCDAAAVVRNVEFGRRYRITGTPTMIFADGTRVPGAIAAAQVEKYLADATK